MTRTTSFAALAIIVGAVLALVPGPAATPPARALASAVAVDDTGFHPDDLSVVVGEAVLWTNLGTVEHTVTSIWAGPNPTPTPTPEVGTPPPGPTQAPGLLFDFVLDPGASDSFTFDEPGVYDYFCRDHPEETGRIVVLTSLPITPSPTPSAAPTATAASSGVGGSLPDAATGQSQPAAPVTALGLLIMVFGGLAALVARWREGSSAR